MMPVPDRDKRRTDKDGDPVKVEWPLGLTLIPNVLRKLETDSTLLIEGCRQMLAGHSYAPDDFSVVGINGINGIHRAILDRLWWAEGQRVYLAADADRHTNPDVRRGVELDAGLLHDAGAVAVFALDFPKVDDTDGIDDALARLSEDERAAALAEWIDKAELIHQKPRLIVGNAAITAEEIRRNLGRGELAGLFRRGGQLVHTPRVDEDGYVPPDKELDEDGPAQVQIFERDQLKALVEHAYDCGVVTVDKETGDKGWLPKLVPDTAAKSAHERAKLGLGTPYLRVLRQVTHTPVLRPDGSVLDPPGYDSSTGLLYLPATGLTVPSVSAKPTAKEIDAAKTLFLSLVADFPFVKDEHRATWCAFCFTPLLRPLIKPPYPLELITAPQRGSGKTYLANIQKDLHGAVFRSEFPRDAEEQRKAISSILLTTTAPIVVLDNLRGRIESSVLDGLLSSADWADRQLSFLKNLDLKNDRLWVATSNNAKLGGDTSRRTLVVRINADMPEPWRRTGFKIKLPDFVIDHRGEILSAMLTLARGWVLDGMPRPTATRTDSFGDWGTGLAGLLEWMQVPGLLDKAADEAGEISEDDMEWGEWIAAQHDAFGDRGMSTPEIVEALEDHRAGVVNRPTIDPGLLPAELANLYAKIPTSHGRIVSGADGGFRRSLGRWYMYREDLHAGEFKTERVGDRPARWRVVRKEHTS